MIAHNHKFCVNQRCQRTNFSRGSADIFVIHNKQTEVPGTKKPVRMYRTGSFYF